jgi:hypothetical protein
MRAFWGDRVMVQALAQPRALSTASIGLYPFDRTCDMIPDQANPQSAQIRQMTYALTRMKQFSSERVGSDVYAQFSCAGFALDHADRHRLSSLVSSALGIRGVATAESRH